MDLHLQQGYRSRYGFPRLQFSTNLKDIEFHTDFKGYGYTHFNTDFKDINLHTDFKGYGF